MKLTLEASCVVTMFEVRGFAGYFSLVRRTPDRWISE